MEKKKINTKSIKPIVRNSAFIIISVILLYFIIKNFLLLSNDTINGNFSAEGIKPPPHYPFVRVHSNPLTEEYNAVNKIGADFAQIYFNALSLSSIKKAYEKKTTDPWERPSRYAPLIHAICLLTFSNFDYGYASFLHMLVQLLIFYLSFIYIFKILDIRKFLLPVLLLVSFYLFLTPTGISHFGRGQFSLYVTLGYLWLIVGIFKRNIIYIILSALFAYVKFTSFPFILVVLAIWILNSKNVKELKHSVLYTTVFGLTIALFFLSFLKSSIPFIVGALEQEAFFSPGGFSLVKILPKQFVKLLPIILIILGYVHIKKYNNNFILLIPFLVGSGIILNTYPTLAYFYSIPYLFAFLPLLIFWLKHIANENYVPANITVYIFPVFLLIVSFSINIIYRYKSHNIIIYIFIIISLFYLLFPLMYSFKMQKK